MTKQLKRFENQIALVTGGRSGIGQAIARRLCDEGATVITAQRSEDKEVGWAEAHFSNPGAPERIIKEVIARTGKFDGLLNNAGMMHEATIEGMSVVEWPHNLSVNLTAPFLFIRAALPYLRQLKGN